MKKIIAFILSAVLAAAPAVFSASAAEAEPTLKISSSQESKSISRELYGAFIEDISFACDGGLVSNLVKNNSFEYKFNNLTSWQSNNIGVTVENTVGLNKNNPSYARLTADGKGVIKNSGFTEIYEYKTNDYKKSLAEKADMGFKSGEKYNFSCYLLNEDFSGTVSVYLDSPSNKSVITQLDISAVGNQWTRIEADLEASKSEDGGLAIELDGTGTLLMDFVSLVPHGSYGYDDENWKYTTLRSDLLESLQDLKPKFIRFPGGCLAEGDSLENLYNWKNTIGPSQERVQGYNLRRDDNGREYPNSMAMGYHEYFQLCADLNAQPVPVVNAGIICRSRADYENHLAALKKSSMSNEEWESYLTREKELDPKKDREEREEYTKSVEALNINSREDFNKYVDTIALNPETTQWKAYVRDVLDLIEYANADATTSYWGALRSSNGSENPFNMKYISIGNENWGEVYLRNFRELYKEIKKAYPEIKIIASSGTSIEGVAYLETVEALKKDFPDVIIDEHFYGYGSEMQAKNDRYDSADRKSTHIMLGEYSATSPKFGTIQTKSTIYEAAEEASFLTGLERNGDIVDMASYAPMFAKVNSQCRDVNLVWFDSREIVLTPSYYAHMLFSNNYGSEYLNCEFENGETNQNGIYQSVTVDKDSQVLYVKLVNTSGKKSDVKIALDGFDANKISVQSIGGKYKSACNEIGKNTTVPTETEITHKNGNFSVNLDNYDVTVVRVAYEGNDGSQLYTLPKLAETSTQDITNYLPDYIKGIIIALPVLALVCGLTAVIIVAIKKKGNSKKA